MTDTTDTIIEILKNDSEAQKLISALNSEAVKSKISPEEYNAAREIFLLVALKNNSEAMKVLSDSLWKEFNR